ncbi:CGNR zinc finger domain-containing protein [Nocardia sp. alder85J]|uniref:CGNR zinc finger domain-containing protein n=1 Tax=Nocardia sp. alder85J TaxID=2862949 RepID=UPI001CD2B730|nr:ABATE domain-containing protein [Nocardia sp. alder85J]MCX4091697.1 ABATE domain-containing protein [Nocardia sp. alder85J]
MTAPAPRFRHGAGRLCLDFLRTLRHRGAPGETDELPDAAALAAWITRCGPCPALPDPAAVDTARRLREAVHTLIACARATGPASGPPATRTLLNDLAAGKPPAPHLDSRGHLHWTASDPTAATLTLIARDALDLVTAADLLPRLRVCEGRDCQALFLDLSRPGTRRWCSMGTCGNRAKKQALRERAAR